MKTIITSLLFLFLTLGLLAQDKNILYLEKISSEIEQYKLINSKKDIPKKVFRIINKWKKKNSLLKKYSKSKEFIFDMEDVGQPYCCCSYNGLLTRRLVFAGHKDSKWFISYNHGQGRVSNTKLLFIDLKKPDSITIMFDWEFRKEFSQISEYLKETIENFNIEENENNRGFTTLFLLQGSFFPLNEEVGKIDIKSF